ncbi:hypothetical protein NTJ56_05680 [Burkholderia contaminans]|jgi:hypothetical protein|uniref:hypothetical protein n=1 Tax=Burkholderia contaminans TaxID=488447 RepID=UPI001CF19D78|nr:hypothetical protein [Burkholderia contaminans]MCA7918459.1 hypothetical protein [Burkholderia contaminans]UUX38302.1 hypothetical protein NTJ56_05680 [Burkholderia contaminans]
MTQAIAICSSIEGEKIKFETRQFNVSMPVKEGGRLRFGFKLGIRSNAWITESYADSARQVVYLTSMTEVDDEVMGTSLDGWATKPLKEPALIKGSGRHSASALTITGGAYVHIQAAAREHLDNANLADRMKPVEQVRRSEDVEVAK